MATFEYLSAYCARIKSGAEVPKLRRRRAADEGYVRDTHAQMLSAFFPGVRTVSLMPNRYPYDVCEREVDHLVCWLHPSRFGAVPPNMDDILHLAVCGSGAPREFVWFENPPAWKSVPDIPHVHVFRRRQIPRGL
jgi:hypothetical protein